MTVGWGIAGCGWVARDHALPALLAVPDARVVALHDLDAALADRPGAFDVLHPGPNRAVERAALRAAGFLAADEGR